MEQVIFLGDVHREVKTMLYEIKRMQITDSVIIQVGDFGMGFASHEFDLKTLKHINETLKEGNNYMYIIRGNHDDPDFFNGQYAYSNLQLLKDYTQLNILGREFLFIGGAISIDRLSSIDKYETKKKYGSTSVRPMYWEKEQIVMDLPKLETFRNIDVLVTHTCPTWCNPMQNGFYPFLVDEAIFEDPELSVLLPEERANMDIIFNTLKRNDNPLSLHVYGHFHHSAVTEHWGCKHHLVDINEFKLL